jgi:hypothetical protein
MMLVIFVSIVPFVSRKNIQNKKFAFLIPKIRVREPAEI